MSHVLGKERGSSGPCRPLLTDGMSFSREAMISLDPHPHPRAEVEHTPDKGTFQPELAFSGAHQTDLFVCTTPSALAQGRR